MAVPSARTPETPVSPDPSPTPLPSPVAPEPDAAGARSKAGTGTRDRVLDSEIDRLKLSDIQRAYLRERWMGQLSYYGRSARRAQRNHYALRLTAILGGVVVPALVGLNVAGDIAAAVGWVAFGLGLVVAAAVALEEFFRFGERWRHFRNQSELLRGEGWAFLSLAAPKYQPYGSHAEAFPSFVATAEELMRREVGTYVTEVMRPQEDHASRPGKPGAPASTSGRVPEPDTATSAAAPH